MGQSIQEFSAFSPPLSDARFVAHNLEDSANYVSETSHHVLTPLGSVAPVQLAHWRNSLGKSNIDVIQLTCGSEFRVVRTGEADHYLFQLPLQGICTIEHGWREHLAPPGSVFAVNPTQEVRKIWKEPCIQLQLQVNRRSLERLLRSELDHECSEPLIFDTTVQDHSTGRALLSVTRSIWQDMNEHAALRHWRIARSYESNLLIACLGILKHNYREEFHREARPAAPYYVKRAEDFIHANLRNRISMQELIEVSGVSGRSLYYGFRRWRGTTPMHYLRSLRLNLAHDELKRARDKGTNVTQIALGVGYDHLSRFSKDYKKRFGESPSSTML